MDEHEDPLERDHSLCVVLPGGLERTVNVHGSKPVMDFLVSLCASYHLNPSDYTVEALSSNKDAIGFKANSPVGLLDAHKIVLKPKMAEEKLKRPYMPEATVRLLINYNKSHKTVVRVNPRVPLELLLPAVCEKCEFQVESTVLLQDADSEPLDLAKTLNQLGLRELSARDLASPERESPETRPGTAEPASESPRKETKQKENSGFFSLFRRRKKKKQEANEPPAAYSCSTLPADLPKKRRAPPPPAMAASQSVPDNLSNCHLIQRSAESTLRSTKRRAPPPPSASPLQELQTNPDSTVSVGSSNTLKALRENDNNGKLSPSSSPSSQPLSSSRSSLNHHHQAADSCLPAFRGKDLSDARAALAKVLTSSVSRGTLIKRLKNLPHGSSFTPTAPKNLENGVFCSEFEPVFTSDLPTENEWEDPAQRRGLTTFKVVPQKKPNPPDSEVSPEVRGEETSLRPVDSETEAKENIDGSEGEAASFCPEPLSLSTPVEDSDGQNCPDMLLPQVEEKQDGEENQLNDSCDVKPAEQIEGLVPTEYQTNKELVPTEEYQTNEELDPTRVQTNEGLEMTRCQTNEGFNLTQYQINEGLDPTEYQTNEESGATQFQTNEELDPTQYQTNEELETTQYQTNEELETTRYQTNEELETTRYQTNEELETTQYQTNEELETARYQTNEGLDPTRYQTSEGLDTTQYQTSEGLGPTEECQTQKGLVLSEEYQTNSQNEHESNQRHSVDAEQWSFHPVEEKVEVQEEEVSFPSPPPPVFFEDVDVTEETEDPESANPTSNELCDASDDASTSTVPRRKSTSAPSRFAQAVALAVQRSLRLSHSKSSGTQASNGSSSPRSTYSTVPDGGHQTQRATCK